MKDEDFKDEKEKKEYSHMFFKTTPEGSIPHPDRHTIAPDGATTKLTKLESAKINHESMVEGKDNIIDI